MSEIKLYQLGNFVILQMGQASRAVKVWKITNCYFGLLFLLLNLGDSKCNQALLSYADNAEVRGLIEG